MFTIFIFDANHQYCGVGWEQRRGQLAGHSLIINDDDDDDYHDDDNDNGDDDDDDDDDDDYHN